MAPRVTILNTMADRDLTTALDLHVTWGLVDVDLKEPFAGRGVEHLTLSEAEQVANLITERGLSVHCMSTTLFEDVVEIGREEFNRRNLAMVSHLVEVAGLLKPRLVRLIAAGSTERPRLVDSIDYVMKQHPWLFDSYREAVSLLSSAGFRVTIENESGPCLFGSTAEIRSFFAALDLGTKVSLTWDAVNLWRSGTFPSLATYEELRPLITYFHVKGGRADPGSTELKWKSSLAQASWPVREIAARVAADGTSPVICINPPKGTRRDGEPSEGWVLADIEYMRQLLAEERAA